MFLGNTSFIKEAPTIILESIQTNNLIIKIGYFFSLYILSSYAAYIIWVLLRDITTKNNYFNSKSQRVLVVIAHPDDECMFFGPLIVNLVRRQKVVYVLCLSNGDADNKGHLRKQELYDSCKTLGVLAENIILSCSIMRQDGHQHKWKTKNVVEIIRDYVEKLIIDTVVTFDRGGVSGHNNHISLFWAVNSLNVLKQLPVNCRTFVLDSIGLLRKYSSFTDCLISLFVSNNVLILSSHERDIVRQAMRKHKTQYVWYRKLYMCFSRYTYINTFTELRASL